MDANTVEIYNDDSIYGPNTAEVLRFFEFVNDFKSYEMAINPKVYGIDAGETLRDRYLDTMKHLCEDVMFAARGTSRMFKVTASIRDFEATHPRKLEYSYALTAIVMRDLSDNDSFHRLYNIFEESIPSASLGSWRHIPARKMRPYSPETSIHR